MNGCYLMGPQIVWMARMKPLVSRCAHHVMARSIHTNTVSLVREKSVHVMRCYIAVEREDVRHMTGYVMAWWIALAEKMNMIALGLQTLLQVAVV